jgi:hypothetical protein
MQMKAVNVRIAANTPARTTATITEKTKFLVIPFLLLDHGIPPLGAVPVRERERAGAIESQYTEFVKSEDASTEVTRWD